MVFRGLPRACLEFFWVSSGVCAADHYPAEGLRRVRQILGWGTARGHRAVCAAATQLSGRVDLGLEILPPRLRNGVATHGHDGGAAASEGGDEVALHKRRGVGNTPCTGTTRSA